MSQLRRKSTNSKTRHLRKRTSSSKFHHSFVKAKLKLTNTKQSLEPIDITEAKARLKSTKSITTSLEPIVNNLYWAQHEHSRLMGTLCDTLKNITITGEEDKFAIYLKNMGRVHQNLEEIDQMYLINMKDQFLDPLRSFNDINIKQCQDTKLKLKTTKGQFDLKKNSETKLLRTQSEKRINLEKVYSAQSASSKKLDELQLVRTEFMDNVKDMEQQKLQLLNSISQYMDSLGAYSKMHSTNIELQTKMMNKMPPNVDNATTTSSPSNHVDSDTEECFVNDFDETQATLNDWGKTSVVVKEGIFKKRGAVNKSFKKRWFKLFNNKKLTYFDLNEDMSGPNGMLKGHANLANIMSICTKKTTLIEIQTKTRKWIFQFENIESRDEWFAVFQQTCVKQSIRTMAQTANDFGEMFNGYESAVTAVIAPPATAHHNVMNNNINTRLIQSISAMDDISNNMASIASNTIPRTQIHAKNDRNMCRLKFNYPSRVRKCAIMNNGHSVQIIIDLEENKCALLYNNIRYFLQRIDFHTPAEHTIEGKRFEMECHLIHTNEYYQTVVLGFIFSSKQKYKKAKHKFGHVQNKSSALSYHLLAPTKKLKSAVNVPDFTDDDDEESDDETDVDDEWEQKYDLNKENDFLAQFWDELPLRQTKENILLSKSLRFDYLLETASSKFHKNFETNEVNVNMELMEYTGSLTTPPYTEGVKWAISKKTNFIGLKQLNRLSLCWGQL